MMKTRLKENSNSTKQSSKQVIKAEKKNILANFFLVIFVGIFLFSSWQVYSIYKDYKEGKVVYEELSASLVTVVQEEEIELTYAHYNIDFDSLKDTNSDIVAWIRFDSPAIISYPIMDANNNDTYLRTNIYGEYNTAGTLFIEEDNEGDFTDDNTIIYGHNMMNGTMFGQLSSYKSSTFYEVNPYFYIYTPDQMVRKYLIIGASEISVDDSLYYTTNFSSDTTFQTYISAVLENTTYETVSSISLDSSFVTLSTCASEDDRRFVVQGMLIEQQAIILVE
ncbi:MAG: class B sortase [Erysipelotrichaceae bacterium]